MGTNMLRHNFSHNIQLYRLNKRKKHFYNVYTKKSFADNITYHVLTYVNIHPVRGPIHIGNSMFRFYCNTSYINQTKKKNPTISKSNVRLPFTTERMFQFQIHQQHCKHKVKHNFICVSSFFFSYSTAFHELEIWN